MGGLTRSRCDLDRTEQDSASRGVVTVRKPLDQEESDFTAWTVVGDVT
jgi:hypothetical protein